MTREVFMSAVLNEVDKAYQKHGREPWGRHEFYGVIAEEFREMETEIFRGGSVPFNPDEFTKEILHVAAMCLRYCETGDRYNGPVNLFLPRATKDASEAAKDWSEPEKPAFLRKIMD